ncbi:uncharacterized protein KQ657_004629 [Scheffersomyces spartinae]|uniref:Aspartate aminotransferase n=1 Tax=Scheffersomyces spartinae TaxID=45513 RepID=A0A9P8AJ58_9ASCO|nr:uncharacterized protein KQ657_004629 [Scheffersomyces spartinae]KAG7194416.1 hypothetical protein KQ657_004629 [Scheffersomyces spartinae]
MTVTTKFSKLEAEALDPIIATMARYAADPNPNKMDVSIGVYKAADGSSFMFPSVKMAKEIYNKVEPGHNYTTMSGLPEFIPVAQQTVFGDKIAGEGKLATIQTISGTGSLHMAMLILRSAGYTNFAVGTPAWSNYIPMAQHIGCTTSTYKYYDEETKTIDFESVVCAIEEASPKTVFILQTCCHNPTGADLSKNQWKTIRDLTINKDCMVLFDIAYQGFASGDKDEDAWPIRYFYEAGMEFVVCQSFSKNLGLYGERAGALHVVVQDKDSLPIVHSNMVKNFREECSFGPAYGARIVSTVGSTPEIKKVWDQDVAGVAERMVTMRRRILDTLTKLETPGKWDHVIRQTGLFWFSGLTKEQTERMISEYHIYLTQNGRVNVAGLNDANLDQFCKALDAVVRSS